MVSTTQLSMTHSRMEKMPKWLAITALALLVVVGGGSLLLLIALHLPALLVGTWGFSEADALWIVSTLLGGGGWLIDILFPELIPVIGVIWFYIDIVGVTAAVAY